MQEIVLYNKIRWKGILYAIGMVLFAALFVWILFRPDASTGNRILFGFGALFFLLGAAALLIQSAGKKEGLRADRRGIYHPCIGIPIPWELVGALTLNEEGILEVGLTEPERLFEMLNEHEYARLMQMANQNIACGYEMICFDMQDLRADAQETQKALFALRAQARMEG